MAKKYLPNILTDAPVDQLMNWGAFSAKREKTMLPPTILVEPSQNCLVPDGDKVIPRFGSQVKFQKKTPIIDNEGIIGGYKKYKNFAGVEMDVKAYRDATAGEQVLVLFNDVYVPITTNPNTDFLGTGYIYFATYTDTNLDLSKNKRLPRLCWVNGYATDDAVPKGVVFSWTGGISQIATIAANVITIPSGQTWRKLGFSLTPDDTAIAVTINGVEYTSSDPSELDTDTLTLNASPTAVVGDIVTSAVEVDELVAPLQMLRMSKNYMYYGSEKLRQWFMSNQFGRPNNVIQIGSNAELDDMNVVSDPEDYTGSNLNNFRIQVVEIDPPVNDLQQTYNGTGSPVFFDTSGYSVANGNNKYEMKCVYTQIITGKSATYSPPPEFEDGEIVIGGTTGAVGIIYQSNPITINLVAGLQVVSGQFKIGETITGQGTGATIEIFSLQSAIGVCFYKNGIIQTGMPGMGGGVTRGVYQASLNGQPLTTPWTFIDGLTVMFPDDTLMDYGDVLTLIAVTNEGGPDQIAVSVNGGTFGNPFDITGSPQTVAALQGIMVEFGQTEGHKVGDYWNISANRGVSRPWADFYYTLDFNTQQSARRPGEGYIYDIPSPFWTMDTFEDSMYLNTSDGNWGYTNPTLSADLKSEDISFVPLKQVGSSKVLYPYLTGHSRNDFLYIDENRNLQSLGRRMMLQKLQAATMSNDVLNKFQSLSFEDGSILFQDNNINITSPHDNTMMVWNERKSYWQPPQFIPNLGLLTNIGNDLYVHSYIDTATRKLNDPDAEGDDGIEYEVIIRNSTYDHGNRWMKKSANMGFWEGYIFEKLPAGTMKMNLYLDPNGCAGIKRVDIEPVFGCDTTNAGNFGGGNDGNHEFGGAENHKTDYARYNWAKLGVVDFYFSSMEFTCRTKKHTYEVLSMGINLAQSKINNKEYRTPESAIDSLLPL